MIFSVLFSYVRKFRFGKCIFFLCLLNSCVKDRTLGPCPNFEDLPQTYNYVGATDRRYFYYTPHFNPNNNNEFTCLRGDETDQIVSLIVYNLQTSLIRNVYSSNKIWDSPRWSKKDWLVFGQQGVLYKIKSSGDSLTQISFSNSKHFPSWNYDGTKIIYHTNEQEQAIEIIDENGSLLKRMARMTNAGVDWSVPNGLIASGIGDVTNQIKLIDESTYNSTLIDIEGSTNNYGICWLDDHNLLYIALNNIYKVNIDTKNKVLIKQGCETKSYVNISVSSDKQKIIVCTLEYSVNSTNKTIEGHREIYLMNIDGSNETKIELPKY